MPKTAALQNNFTGGLKTEFTGLNFPENACTDTDNCVFTIVGDVIRRGGINIEPHGTQTSNPDVSESYNTYRWKNAGGDGESEIVIVQTGSFLNFYRSSQSTINAPLSTTFLSSQDISGFLVAGSTQNVASSECQFADGNGFLFIFHPFCESMYATFNPGSNVVQINQVNIQIRDFNGFNDNLPLTFRPPTLSAEHQYNLLNQGWATSSAFWNATSNSAIPLTGIPGQPNHLVPTTGLPQYTFGATPSVPGNIVVGQPVIVTGQIVSTYLGKVNITNVTLFGTLVSYNAGGPFVNVKVTSYSIQGVTFPGVSYIGSDLGGTSFSYSWTITPANTAANLIGTWFTAFNNYPSNADIWFIYKDSNGVFNPATTAGNVVQPQSHAPQGHFIVNAFNQDFSGASGVPGLTGLSTNFRPTTGCWHSGRVWFSGVNGSQFAMGDQTYYTWTENIYFSQVITSQSNPQFGKCYQENDPTDENFNALLPSDGGVVTIQGAGDILKLFPIANGVLVFASNGIWMIAGNQGFGFTADDFSVFKISGVQNVSATSVTDVNGLPMFWNQEGIYAISQSQGNAPYKFGGFQVEPITVGTILSFYNEIPTASKQYVRGAYDPINYIVTWVYRSTPETGITDRYRFDRALNLNVYNKAFYPYTFSNNAFDFVSGIFYLSYPPGVQPAAQIPTPQFKYLVQNGFNQIYFAEENDFTNFSDWISVDYTSFFITGFSLAGKGISKWTPIVVEMYSRGSNKYTIQGIYDYASSGNTGRFSSLQVVSNPNNVTYQSGIGGPDLNDYTMYYRRHKLRGYGQALQIKVSSVTGQPYDIMGWGVVQDINQGI